MLRKAASAEGKDWDKLIPYLLFAYREVPQDSTGFSPFELLYGRAVRGPLDVIKDSWIASEKSDESIVSYILHIREKLAAMVDIMEVNLDRSQRQQKKWYDKSAREREFQIGDHVLVLLPTSANKLLAQWQGPYLVKEKVGKVNYCVEMHDRRKKLRLFHVNMLKQWHAPAAAYWTAIDSPDFDDNDDVPVWKNNPNDTKLTFGQQLSQTQREDLQHLLCDYQEVMSAKPGRTSVIEHSVNTGSSPSIRLPSYRIPHAYRDEICKEIQEMLDSGIIEPSLSNWSSPLVPVTKKDGSLRLCVDYRKVNAVSKMDAYPMPRVDNIIDQLGKAKFITTLDLTRGYWQVPMADTDRHKTAFSSPMGLFQFRVMPFGLCGAPATFQRLMDRVLSGFQGYSAAYLDDLVIYSDTWQEHLQHLRHILQRLKSNGLTAKPTKCQFGMAQCSYLGHRVGSGIILPEMDKLEAVKSYPIPKTKKDVRSFLGLTGYYRKFISGYASMSAPLTNLTRKTAPNAVTWTDECDRAFVSLKTALCSAPVLYSPRFDIPFILQTDASDRGIAAILSQVLNKDGSDHPIAFFSRKLLPREQRYSTVEKECLAIKAGMEAFRVYLLGRPFTVQTDHRALAWLYRLQDSNSRLACWSLALQPYDFTVVHRKGTANGNADALSRSPE